MRAATYERVSTNEQANEGFSLEAQREKNMAYITTENWNYIGSFTDPGYSGKNLSRPGIKSLINEIERKNIDAIIVHKLDRLTRNIGDLYDLLDLFDKHNVKFISITEKIDTSSAMGRMFIFILGIFAQWYRENLAEEVRKGMEKRTKKGFHNVTVPLYGYKLENGELIINPDEAKWVKWIFQQYISGIGTTNIAKRLNEMGIRRKSGAKWDQHKVMTTLSNVHYLGKVHWKDRNKEEKCRIISDGKHEAIIDEKTFEQAKYILQRRREGTISKNSYDYIFSGIIVCGKCGGKYKGKYTKRTVHNLYRGYVCSNNENYGTCDQSAISEIKLSKLLFDNINLISMIDDFHDDTDEIIDEREEIKKQIKSSENRRSRWQLAYGDGYMPYEDFAKRMSEEMEKVKLLEERLSEISISMPSIVKPEEAFKALTTIQENWNAHSYDTRKQFIQSFFKKIEITNTNGKWSITDIILC
ncbi:recombinase family protein [Paenibacillus larvae]